MQINQSTLRMSVAASFAWLTHIILRLHGQHQPPSLNAEYGKTMCASLGHTDIPKEVFLEFWGRRLEKVSHMLF